MTKQELIEKHGTLDEFRLAVINASNHLMITDEEAAKAINEYKLELANADINT